MSKWKKTEQAAVAQLLPMRWDTLYILKKSGESLTGDGRAIYMPCPRAIVIGTGELIGDKHALVFAKRFASHARIMNAEECKNARANYSGSGLNILSLLVFCALAVCAASLAILVFHEIWEDLSIRLMLWIAGLILIGPVLVVAVRLTLADHLPQGYLVIVPQWFWIPRSMFGREMTVTALVVRSRNKFWKMVERLLSDLCSRLARGDRVIRFHYPDQKHDWAPQGDMVAVYGSAEPSVDDPLARKVFFHELRRILEEWADFKNDL